LSDLPLERAQEAIRKGETEQARRILVAFIEKQPKSAAGWRLLSQCVEKESEAIFCLERALKLDPGDEQARLALARLHGRRQPASAVSSQPGHPGDTQPMQVVAPDLQASREKPPPTTLQTKIPEKSRSMPWKDGEEEAERRTIQRPRNWPLAFGFALVALVLLLAIAGPSLAPRDPLEEHNIFQIQGQWHIPPLDPLTPATPSAPTTSAAISPPACCGPSAPP
jgi:hypothetical protein